MCLCAATRPQQRSSEKRSCAHGGKKMPTICAAIDLEKPPLKPSCVRWTNRQPLNSVMRHTAIMRKHVTPSVTANVREVKTRIFKLHQQRKHRRKQHEMQKSIPRASNPAGCLVLGSVCCEVDVPRVPAAVAAQERKWNRKNNSNFDVVDRGGEG